MQRKIVLILSFVSSVLMAQETAVRKSFDDLWSDFYQKSLHQKSLKQEKHATELSLERAQRHWLPRAYVAGQWFSTNDPNQIFFNNLGQRSIKQTDFVPANLNDPSRTDFKTGTLGLDLPLFEGGSKVAQTSMLSTMVKASEVELKAKKTQEYAQLGAQYGGALIHSKHILQLSDLKKNLKYIINSYQVGAKSNPVGHSGLLGLKSVNNRIEATAIEFEMKFQNAKNWINTKTENQRNWIPESKENLQSFLQNHLSLESNSSYSSALLAEELKVKTLDDVKNMERSRFLPRVGLFANNNFYDGSRDNQTTQSYGIYVKWDLFNSDSFGRVQEARVKAMAAEAKLAANKQEEKIMQSQLYESKLTLEKNLSLLRDSDQLLQEQGKNAMKLFRSGLISALQLAEVINRRVDLIENKSKAELQYLDVYSKLYQLNN